MHKDWRHCLAWRIKKLNAFHSKYSPRHLAVKDGTELSKTVEKDVLRVIKKDIPMLYYG